MATRADLGSISDVGTGFTTLTKTSITATTGRMLVVAATVGDAFNSAVFSGFTHDGNAFTSVVARKGYGGNQWRHASIWLLEVASGTTASVVGTLDKNLSQGASRASFTVYEITDYNTSTPSADTDFAEGDSVNNNALTLDSAADEILISAIVCESSSGRWIEPKSGTTADDIYDPDPGTIDGWKMGHGSKTAAGASTSIGWDFFVGGIAENMAFVHVAAVFPTAGGGGGGIARIIGGKILGGNIINGGLVG